MVNQEMTSEREKQIDCSCPACGCSDFDGYCSDCKHTAEQGKNFYTDEPVVLKKGITTAQQEELNELLAEDILERYNNSEYWEPDLITEFYHDNNIKQD
ncbi:hypothetical protein LCGC14_0929120 [marine sediment metagenome]|uniref:Uncharacterized protein n=1 Tax=marine sediment metagenome TaxID=412755 RepID=A0A0F9R706_9ZZZZ